MTKQVLLASVFAFGAVVAPASAGTWNGFYIGLNAGGAFGDTDWTNVSNTTGGGAGAINFAPGQTIDQSVDGVGGGAQLGYNYQMSNWLFGLEVGWSALDYDETTLNTNPGDTNEFVTSEINWLASAALRAGWTWDNSVVYLKGGYAMTKVNTDHFDPGNLSYSTDEDHSGWTAGAGIEHQIGDNVSVGLEYNYYDFGNQDHTGTTAGPATVVNDIDVTLQTVTARLSYHFNPF
ncbi:MAG: porin family protein [Alphaproteobacteria bacterium]|nr:porin family protein [Alphaproteobacteria bacterium]